MHLKKIVNSFLIVAAVALVSCDDEAINIPHTNTTGIESYNAFFAHFPTLLYVYPPNDNLVKFTYDSDNRIVKKTGDIFYTSPGTGSSGYLSDSLFTDLDYYGNKVRLTKNISYLGYSIPSHETEVTFNSNNRMLLKTRNFEINSGILRKDTTHYTYSDNRITQFTKTYNQVTGEVFDIRFSEASIVYYTGVNVDSIVTTFSLKYSDTPFTVLQKKEIEIFSNYDSAPNPFKSLEIFEETFTRSLSANNYREYKKLMQVYQYPDFDFYQEPILHPATELMSQEWNLLYDSNGEWIYNQGF